MIREKLKSRKLWAAVNSPKLYRQYKKATKQEI